QGGDDVRGGEGLAGASRAGEGLTQFAIAVSRDNLVDGLRLGAGRPEPADQLELGGPALLLGPCDPRGWFSDSKLGSAFARSGGPGGTAGFRKFLQSLFVTRIVQP